MANSVTEYASELPEFAALLKATGQYKSLPPTIIEKDYYLIRVLRALVAKHAGHFILKGGTSLSKGWQLLQRFSEDIDILVRSENGWGSGRRDKRLKALQSSAGATHGIAIESMQDAETGVHRAVRLKYESVTDDVAGLSKTLLLEMGYRGQAAASTQRPVRSMVSEFAVSKGQEGLAEDLTSFDVEVQRLQRTAVEKLFAAHGAYEQNHAAGKTRHYYDIYELFGCTEVRDFVGTTEYKECVVEVRQFSEEHFPGQPVPDGDSFSGSVAFAPKGEDLKALETNYKAEATLFFGKQPPLADVLSRIQELLSKL